MSITSEEKLMYQVMKAIYESGIPINFKGSMVLKAYLVESGYNGNTRHTVDIDANWYSDNEPTAEQMVESLQKAIQSVDVKLKVKLYRMYGKGRSAGFELSEASTGEILFTMDIDVNRPIPKTKIYEIADIRFCGVAPIQIISDKISAISTDKVFRRIKDVIDLYYISQVFSFETNAVIDTINNSGKSLDNFNGFLNRITDLQHSYEKFRFSPDVNKPDFEEVYSAVKEYIKDFLPSN